MKPTVNNLDHVLLERYVKKYLEDNNFEIPPSVTYHDQWPKELVRDLAKRFSMTSIYLRTRADRVAIHRELPVEFEYEIKTVSPRNNNFACEAIPMCFHVMKSRLGVRCLYAFGKADIMGRGEGWDVAFWVGEDFAAMVDKVHIPTVNIGATMGDWLKGVSAEFFPNAEIKVTGSNRGSGDPFVIVEESKIRALPSFDKLIGDECRRCFPGFVEKGRFENHS